MGTQHIVVVGAGIVGAASAIWLRRAGLEVTLVDKGAPGMGASYGNACILARSAIVPVTTPGLIPKGPRYLFDPNFPLFMRWSYLPKLLPWLAKYLKNANDADTRRISKGLATVVGDSVEQHKALTDGMPAAKWIQDSEYNFVYRDRAAFEADAYTWALRGEAGFVPEIIEGDAVREREPILSPDMRLLAVNKDHGFILNPGSYVQDLVTQFEGMGGRFLQAEVKDFELMGGQVTAVATDQGRLVCDKAVLSAGVWSGALMKKLGLEVPLEAERGYHIIFKNPSQRPNNPMMLTEGKFVATPMDQGLRCAEHCRIWRLERCEIQKTARDAAAHGGADLSRPRLYDRGRVVGLPACAHGQSAADWRGAGQRGLHRLRASPHRVDRWPKDRPTGGRHDCRQLAQCRCERL